MIQFNLLPDLKLEYIKTQRQKKSIYTIAVVVLIISVGIIILLWGALGVQKGRIAIANNSIEENTKKLQSVKDLEKVLTVENQLDTLKELHAKKVAASRLFTYLPQVTPTNASIGQLSIDFASNTLEISGTADSLSTVNKFADTLKLSKYTAKDGGDEQVSAFKSVVLKSIGSQSAGSSYTISMEFDPALFDGQQSVRLVVPQLISTRSFTELPNKTIFDGNVGDTQNGDGQ